MTCAFVSTSMGSSHLTRIVCPALLLSASNNTSTKERIRVLEKWHADGGVFLMGYTMFRELSVTTKSNAARNEDTSNRFKHLLLTPGPSLVFADEGHTIKNKNVWPHSFNHQCN